MPSLPAVLHTRENTKCNLYIVVLIDLLRGGPKQILLNFLEKLTQESFWLTYGNPWLQWNPHYEDTVRHLELLQLLLQVQCFFTRTMLPLLLKFCSIYYLPCFKAPPVQVGTSSWRHICSIAFCSRSSFSGMYRGKNVFWPPKNK